MDNSRDIDLKLLHQRFTDTSLPMYKRNKAYRKYQNILQKMKDRTLVGLRHRLIKAHIAEDADEAERIEYQIRNYLWRVYKEGATDNGARLA